jgi:pyruvate,water dikinase
LKRVWCELFRARSLFYWQRLGIQLQQIQFAVLVQPIHSVMAAGELQINGNHLQIQAVWGLGHALAQGSHDDYRFEPSSGWQIIRSAQQIYSCQVSDGETTGLAAWITTSQDCPTSQDCLRLDLLTSVQQSQPVLTSTQLQQLAQLAQQLQTELGMPLRLEWMFDPVNLQTLPPSPSESSPRAFPFQITQITPQFGLLTAQRDAAIRSVAPLIGLAAAPGRAIAGAWLIRDTADLRAIPVGAIAVTSLVTPEQIMRLRQAAGVVTEQGGITSHAAILARELGIPAVVGVAEVTRLIRTGDRVAIDGDRGEVYYGDFSLESDWLQINPTAPLSVPLASSLPAPLSTRLFVTLSQLDHLAEIAALPVDGVGLLRSELMLLDRFQQDLPEVWLRHQIDAAAQIADRVEQFAAAFAPRSVFYRSFDLQLQEADPIPSRPHPMLGLRGAFSYQFNLDLLQVQLDALRLVQQRGYDNVSLLLPFVRTVEEFNFCRQQVEQVGLLQQQNFQLWIMAEVPSVLLLLPDYVAAGVQGIAIGTNDLTQLLLGADRNHPQMATAFDPAHPVVLRAIQQLIHTARQMGIPCSVCGQSVGRVDLLTQLLQWGVTSVSVDPSEVEPVYQTIQHYYQNQDLKEI